MSAEAVANEFLELALQAKTPVTHMKLQKLVYFAHGWNLGLYGQALSGEPVQAWKWGPVFSSIYREFRDYKDQPIDRLARDIELQNGRVEFYEPRLADHGSKELVQKVWQVYSRMTAIQLSNLTHEAGSPWDRVAARFNYRLPRGLTIPNDLIREYFAALAAQSNH